MRLIKRTTYRIWQKSPKGKWKKRKRTVDNKAEADRICKRLIDKNNQVYVTKEDKYIKVKMR